MQDYNKILDRVYELEGLVLLALSGDNKTARLPELIYMKAFEITELAMPKPQPPTAPSAEAPVAPAPVRSRFAPVAGREPEPLEEHEPEPLPEPELLPEPEPSSKPEPSSAPASSKKPSFSLNDHFLFIRELFGGDSEEFNRAMNNLASLDSFDEAEEFFFAEYDWDSENETTQSFMNCIFNYFNIAPSSK